MAFDINAIFDDPRFAESLALFGATGPHNAGLLDAAKTMQQMKQLKAQQEMAQRKFSLEQQEHESMAGYRKGQLKVAEATAEKYGAQVAAQVAEMQRKRELAKQGMDMAKQFMGGAGTSPQPEMPGPSVPGAAAPLPPAPMQVPRGKHGTPAVILDNLEKVESGGNPLAIGPDIGGGVKALGAYQFLPSTISMLRQQGITFDPFKRDQARDAADYYIQQLAKQHGGDYAKALAAYGGFKTKDATGYVSKVLAGSDEKQAKQHSQFQNLQTQTSRYKQAQQAFGALRLGHEDPAGYGMIVEGMKPDYEAPKLAMDAERLELQKGADQRAQEDQAIQQEKAAYERTQRPAQEAEQAAEIAQKQAAADEKRTKVEVEAKQRDQAKVTAQSIINEMRKSYDKLDATGGIVSSEKGLFHNLPAAVQASPLGQQIQRITGTANQKERSNLEMARPLLLQSLAQALGMGVRQLDNVKEFEMYLKAATDPTMDVAANKQALDRLEQILTGKAPLTIMTPQGEKKMTLEEARKLPEPAQKPMSLDDYIKSKKAK